MDTKTNPVKKFFHKSKGNTELFLVCIFIVLFIFFSIASPYFCTSSNIGNLLTQTAVNGIVAMGMLFVIISAGIDLSVGAVVGLSGMVVSMLITRGVSIPLAVIISVVAGAVVGLLNGVLVHDGKVPAFIATLGTMMIIRAVIMIISDAKMVSGLPKEFIGITKVKVIGLPFLFVAWLIVIAISYVISKHTVFGRNIYAVGSNVESARLSGINVRGTTYGIYVFSGFVCAIAGVLMTARLGSGVPTGGLGYEMDAVAAAVVGGASLEGGAGTVLGTILGAIIMTTLRQGGNLLGVNSFVLDLIIGVILIVAVLLDKKRKK